jgi:hypothetical protein
MKKSSIIILIVCIFSGCESLGNLFNHTQIGYDLELIKQSATDSPTVIWSHPSIDEVSKIGPPNSLFNVSYPMPLDVTLKGVEPPYISEMTVTPNGSLVCLGPTGFAYQIREGETGFHKFRVPIPESYRVFSLEPNSGNLLWSTDIETRGLANLMTIGTNTILITVLDHNLEGANIGGSFHSIDISNGKINFQLGWEGPLSGFNLSNTGNTLVFGIGQLSEKDEELNQDFLGTSWKSVNVLSGKGLWDIFLEPGVQTVTFGDSLIVMDQDLLIYDYLTGEEVWKSPGITGKSYIGAYKDYLLFESDQTMTLVDSSGQRNYDNFPKPKGQVQRFKVIDKNQLLLHSEESEFTPPKKRRKPMSPNKLNMMPRIDDVFIDYEKITSIIELLDIFSSERVWVHTIPGRIMSDVAFLDGMVAVTSPDTLVVLDSVSGEQLFDTALPWSDFFTVNAIYQIESRIIVESEFHVAAFDSAGGEMIYYHHFSPLWESISTTAKALDERAGFWMLENVVGIDFGKSWVEMTMDTESNWRNAETEALGKSRRKINMAQQPVMTMMNTSWMNPNYDIVSNKIVYDNSSVAIIGSAVASFQTNMALLSAMTVWAREVGRQVQGSNANNNRLAYPYIQHEIDMIRTNDRPDRIVRLTAAGEEKNLTVLEILNASDGSVKSIPLSPRQAPNVVDPILATGAYKIGIYGGYLPYIPFLYHSFRTLIDWENEIIYHYGPGLDPTKYISFDGLGNYRSLLWAFQLRE